MAEEDLIATEHSKIFIGKPGDFKLAVVKQQINELIDVIGFGNVDILRKKISEVVPTYKILETEVEQSTEVEQNIEVEQILFNH